MDVKYEHPSDHDTSKNVYFYIVKCALPSEQESGDYSHGKPFIVYDRTLASVKSAKEKQKEILRRHGFQSFWTIGKPCHGAFY